MMVIIMHGDDRDVNNNDDHADGAVDHNGEEGRKQGRKEGMEAGLTHELNMISSQRRILYEYSNN